MIGEEIMKLSVIAFMLLLLLALFTNGQTNFVNNQMKDKILTVNFCEMVKNPKPYLEKTTQITAQISPFDEGLYFLTENTNTPNSVGALGVSFANKNSKQHSQIEKTMDLIHTPQYSFRAVVIIVGVLHKKTLGNYFSRVTNYEYEIIRFEKLSPLIVDKIVDKIPTVAFCEMVKNPKVYFDKTIRLTATFTQATEAQYLNDEACPLTHDEQIGVGYAESDKNQLSLNISNMAKINSPEYGSRAIVTIIGVLKDSSLHAFAWYQYRFEIVKFENVSHVIAPYNQELEASQTYRTDVYFDKNLGLSLVKPFRLPAHYAYHVDWVNLKKFPELKKIESKTAPQTIVFSVLSKQIKQMTESRWNVIYECKIIRVE